MPFRQILNLKGINVWYLASAIILNLFWTLSVSLFLSTIFLKLFSDGESIMPVFLLLITFIGPFLIGWVIGKMSGDSRGPAYGFYGSLGGAVIMAYAVLSTGIMGLMLVIAALAGGLNGGLFSLQRR